MLAAALENQHIEINQCEGDTDVVTVQTVLEMSQKGYPTIVTQDVDILVLMIAHALPDKPVLLMKPPIVKVKKKIFLSSALQQQHQNFRKFILLVHGFSECDFTNAVYGKGEKQLLKTFEANAPLMEHVRVFNSTDSTANEIEKARQRLFLFLYGATNYNISLDNIRYILLRKSLKKIIFNLESLPPTSVSGAKHSSSTYY